MPGTIWIVLAIGVVVIARRFSPIIGASLAALLSITLGVWGYFVYFVPPIGTVAFAGFPLKPPAFYALVVIWFGFEIYGLIKVLKMKNSAKKNNTNSTLFE
ncbi:hypothetical protein KAI87_09060 [Myxococcota bacterium]|nr:hypothetical protein [Myxococcota bacterium]